MPSGLYDFTCEQGATFEKRLRVATDDGPLDFTGFGARMHVRPRIIDAFPEVELTTENGRIVLSEDVPNSFSIGSSGAGSYSVYGEPGIGEQSAQDFVMPLTSPVTTMDLFLYRQLSPVDNCYITLSETLDGTPLATSNQVPIATIKQDWPAEWVTFTFPAAVSLTGGTRYYIQLHRTARDTGDAMAWVYDDSSGHDGEAWGRHNGVWSEYWAGIEDFMTRFDYLTPAPDPGVIDLLIPANVTATIAKDGVYDLELIDTAGDVSRLLKGQFKLDQEVTR